MTKYLEIEVSELEGRGIDFSEAKKVLKLLPDGAWIAGGYYESVLRGAKPKDIDVFFCTQYVLKITMEGMIAAGWEPKNYKKGDEEKPETRFVQMEKDGCLPVQLIRFSFYENAQACVDTFDFTATQIASLGKDKLVYNAISFVDIYRLRLVLHKMTFPASTLRRMLKYAAKGYHVCPGSLQTIAAAIPHALAANPQANGIVYLD